MNNSDLQTISGDIFYLKNQISIQLQNDYYDYISKILNGLNSQLSNQDPTVFYDLILFYEDLSNKYKYDFLNGLKTEIDSKEYIRYEELDYYYDPDTCIDDEPDGSCTNYLKDITTSDITISNLKYNDFKFMYKIMEINIDFLKKYIDSEIKIKRQKINSMRNDEQFAKNLHKDYSEIYKYKYLRNWGFFLSIIGCSYYLTKIFKK